MLLLYLDLQYEELKELHSELDQVYRDPTGRMSAVEGKLSQEISETDRRIGAANTELSKKIDETDNRG